MRKTLGVLAAWATVAMGGCAYFDTYNNDVTVGTSGRHGHEVFVDAKQRVVVTVPVRTTTYTYGRNAATATETALRFCAEPSPDALSAFALSASGSLDVEAKGKAAGAINAAESAASIGLRTQSIQLMRDSGYRLCEAAASGLLSSVQFETLERRYQSAMVAILAIEQLTGTVRAQQAALSTSSAVTANADALVKLTASIGDAKKTVADDQAAATADQTQADTDKKAASDFLAGGDVASLSTDDATAYKAKTTTADASAAKAKTSASKLKTDQAALDDIQKSLDVARAASLTANGAAALGEASTAAAQTADVASAVKGIVSQALEMGFLRETCASLMTADIDGRTRLDSYRDGLAGECRQYFAATVETYKSYASARTTASAYVNRQIMADKPIDTAVLKVLLNTGSADDGDKPPAGSGAPAGDGGNAAALKLADAAADLVATIHKALKAPEAAKPAKPAKAAKPDPAPKK